MPLGDSKHNKIYEELVNILGERYVTDDRGAIETFWREPYAFQIEEKLHRVEFIALPESTEDIRLIIKLANRLEFPYSISSSGMFISTCGARKPYWVYIHPKRMDKIEIDEKKRIAIVEPAATIAQVQAEAFKRGYFVGVPGASTQGSCLAGNVYAGIHWTSWRTGIGRSIMGLEEVLPNGDIMRTGSLSMPGAGWFWGEGPGPDFRGLLRGFAGHLGSMGVVTKMAVHLNSWPGPSAYPTEGVQPEKVVHLPKERFQSYFYNFPTLKHCVDAMHELAKAEIGGSVMKFAPFDFIAWTARTRDEFWEKMYADPFWVKMAKEGNLLTVCLWGFASEKQVTYEKKVLDQIIKETEGEEFPPEQAEWLSRCFPANLVRDTHRNRFFRVSKTGLIGSIADSMDDMLRSFPEDMEVRDHYTPPHHDFGHDGKSWPGDFGRVAWSEVDTIGEKSEEYDKLVLDEILPDYFERLKKGKVITAVLPMVGKDHIAGPLLPEGSPLLRLQAEIKKMLDPKNLANPTRVVDLDKYEQELAEADQTT